jgi:hypothetical protein
MEKLEIGVIDGDQYAVIARRLSKVPSVAARRRTGVPWIRHVMALP